MQCRKVDLVSTLLSGVIVVSALAGCGDDTNDGTALGDAGTTSLAIRCPQGGPTPADQQRGECCYRDSNEARSTAPSFRLAAIDITAPRSFTDLILSSLIANAIDQDRLNWLLAVGASEETEAVSLRTGSGKRQADGSFAFTEEVGALPYAPIDFEGSLSSDSFSAGPAQDTVTVFIGRQGSEANEAEIPIRELVVERAQMSADRNCIGERIPSTFDTTQGELSGFLAWEDASLAMAGLGGLPPARLCTYLLGLITGVQGACEDIPKSDWSVPPDSTCDDEGCTEGGCDGLTECNAWRIRANFAAQAVRIQS